MADQIDIISRRPRNLEITMKVGFERFGERHVTGFHYDENIIQWTRWRIAELIFLSEGMKIPTLNDSRKDI